MENTTEAEIMNFDYEELKKQRDVLGDLIEDFINIHGSTPILDTLSKLRDTLDEILKENSEENDNEKEI